MTGLEPVSYSTSDFDYELPETLIAQHPLDARDSSRMLALSRTTGAVSHKGIREFPSLLNEGDVLVRNTSRVLKARLFGTRDNGRQAEVLLVHPDAHDTWLAMVHPGGKLKVGRKIFFSDDAELEVTDVVGGGLRRLKLTGSTWNDLMERFGVIPLPPYIERPPEAEDLERYQTVFGRDPGSVAAPTAGLHFTDSLLHEIKARGISFADIVLHVGPGTFKPVQVENPANHTMHAEWYRVSIDAANIINETIDAGNKVWAVGTTATRVLETVGKTGAVMPGEGWTDLFITPPHEFAIVRGMLTNFHLPCSTLLMLISAFGGYDHVRQAYRSAVKEQYRFYSYGDAMAIF